MRYKLKKLAIALRDMEQKQEAEELESMIHSYYGDWLQELPQLATDLYHLDGMEAKRAVHEKYKNFYWAGSGAFRYAMGITGDDSFVVKIARRPRGSMMNESEFNKQTEFGGLFPRVHYHGSRSVSSDRPMRGSEFDWIVIDKVSVIRSEKELGQFFPALIKEMEEQKLSSISGILGRLLDWASYREAEKNPEEDFIFINSLRTYVLFSSPAEEERNIRKLLKSANKDSMFRRLAMLSAKLGIDAKDLTVGNLGTNSNGELVVLDASFSKDFETSPYIPY
jgi:hypothetical protein